MVGWSGEGKRGEERGVEGEGKGWDGVWIWIWGNDKRPLIFLLSI